MTTNDELERDWEASVRRFPKRYELVREVPEGEHSDRRSFEVLDLHTKRSVILHAYVPMAGMQFDPERFRREASITAQLRHRTILRIFEVGSLHEEGGRPAPYFVQELLPSRTLRQAWAERTGTSHERLTLLGELVDGMGYVHGQGLIHGRLSPETVFLRKDGGPILTGFRYPRNSPPPSALRTSDPFQAPEMARVLRPKELPPIDVYALGALFAFAFQGTTSEQNRSLEPIVKRWKPVITKAIAPAPADRYPSALELAQDVVRLLEGRRIRGRLGSWILGLGQKIVPTSWMNKSSSSIV